MDIKHIFDKKEQKYIISVLAKVTTDELGALTGPLGRLKGIKLKSGVLPNKNEYIVRELKNGKAKRFANNL